MWILHAFELLIACLVLWLGYQLKRKHRINLISDWFKKNIKQEDYKAYTSSVGNVVYIMGASYLLTTIISIFFTNKADLLMVLLSLVIPFLLMSKVQKKYNGGWF